MRKTSALLVVLAALSLPVTVWFFAPVGFAPPALETLILLPVLTVLMLAALILRSKKVSWWGAALVPCAIVTILLVGVWLLIMAGVI